MASPSATPDPTSETSETYTKMSVADVEAIGAHCQMPFCHQLDFLPFRCESCRGKFCLDHRTESAHDCPKAGTWARERRQRNSPAPTSYAPTQKPNVLNHEQQCSNVSCKTLVNTPLTPGIHCPNCNRQYCLKHRMREDHDCAKLTPLGAKPQTQKERGLAALDKLRAWGASRKPTSSSTTKAPAKPKPTSAKAGSSIAAVNKLKQTAKGDDKIPIDKRVYLHVEASADTTTAKYPTGDFYYNKEFSVGRVLDIAAKALQVANVNNRGGGEEDKLRVFHVEGGRLLEFSEKLGDATKTGNTIVILRGVGPAVPDLIEA